MSLNTFQPSRDPSTGAILPVPAVPASTRIAARLKRVQEHSPRVNLIAHGSAGPAKRSTLDDPTLTGRNDGHRRCIVPDVRAPSRLDRSTGSEQKTSVLV